MRNLHWLLVPTLFIGAASSGPAQPKKPAAPQEIAAAEQALVKFGCQLHRATPDGAVLLKGKGGPAAPSQAVDVIKFPTKTTNADLAKLLPLARKLPALVAIDLGDTKVDDECIKADHTRYMASTIPGAQLAILSGLSHFAFLQDPKVASASVLSFLR